MQNIIDELLNGVSVDEAVVMLLDEGVIRKARIKYHNWRENANKEKLKSHMRKSLRGIRFHSVRLDPDDKKDPLHNHEVDLGHSYDSPRAFRLSRKHAAAAIKAFKKEAYHRKMGRKLAGPGNHPKKASDAEASMMRGVIRQHLPKGS